MAGTDLTILVAFGAGVISFLSPCVLPLVPAYLGQLTAIAVAASADGAPPSRWTAVRHALAYVAGFGVVFTLLGITATFLAGPLADYLPALRVIGGLILIVMGLNLAGILPIPALERTWRPLDAGATQSLATVTGSVSLGLTRRRRHAGDGRPAGRPARRIQGRLAGLVRARGDLRHRLDAVHRDHPRRHPDDGGDVRDGRPGRRPAGRLHARPGAAVHRDRRRVRPGSARSRRPLVRHGKAVSLVGGLLVAAIGVAMVFDWLSLMPRYFNFGGRLRWRSDRSSPTSANGTA